jgi:hypothetical protein
VHVQADKSCVEFIRAAHVGAFVVSALLRWWDPQPLIASHATLPPPSPSHATLPPPSPSHATLPPPSPDALRHATPPSAGARRRRDLSPGARSLSPPPKRMRHMGGPPPPPPAAPALRIASRRQEAGGGAVSRGDARDASDADAPAPSFTQLYSRWQVLSPLTALPTTPRE